MDINIRSIVFVIGFIYILQFVVLYYQYRINIKYSGTGWWLLWSGAELAGFVITVVKLFIPSGIAVLILQNLLAYSGFIFMFFGIRRFTGKDLMLRTGAVIFSAYVITLIFLIYFSFGDIAITAVNDIFIAGILIHTSITLYSGKTVSIKSSAVFTSLLLFVRGALSGYLAFVNLYFSSATLLLTPEQRAQLNFINGLIPGIFLTFGFVLMLNQRLRAGLTESVEHFRMIFETSPDSISISIREDGTIIDANESFIKYSGYDRSDLIGKPASETKLWENVKTRERIIAGIKEKGFVDNADVTFYDKQGELNYGLFSARAITINGKSCLLSVTRNITEIRQKEEVINEVNEKFRLAFENANIGMCLVNTDGRIIKANETLGRMLGYTKEELESRDVFSITHPDYMNVSSSTISNAVDGKRFHSEFEKKYLHKNGAEVTATVSTSLVKNSKGEPLYFITQILDISEKKKAQEELEGEKDKYKLLTENMKDVVWTLDPETLYFSYVSPSVKKLRGYTPEEVMAEPMDAALTPEGSRYVREIMKRRVAGLLAGTESYDVYYRDEILQPCKDGSQVWTEVVTNYFFNNKTGKIEIHGVTRDITERKEAEFEIREKNEELTKINAEKDRFFSIIAHDLKSPFNGFLGLTEMLAESPLAFTPEQLRKISLNLNDSANNLHNLLNNLLEWSKIQRGLVDFSPTSVNLIDVVVSVIHLYNESAKLKNIVLSGDIQPDTYVSADKFMLETVIRNLLSNAIKFSNKGGWVSVTSYISGDEVYVSVKDAGIGIDKQMAEDLFQIDKIVSRKGTENEPGTGLGLILCKEYIVKNGGRIWAESDEGRGSVFTFTLKRA